MHCLETGGGVHIAHWFVSASKHSAMPCLWQMATARMFLYRRIKINPKTEQQQKKCIANVSIVSAKASARRLPFGSCVLVLDTLLVRCY